VPFHLANFQCASFAINTIKDPAEVGNVSDSDLYIDSPVGISFVMFVIDMNKTKYSLVPMIRQSLLDFLLLWSFN
jgi:hypothetical protein